MMSPTSAGGYVRRAAPEPNKRALYVGGLDPRVTEDILKQIFETTGHVVSVKIIPDKNVSSSDRQPPPAYQLPPELLVMVSGAVIRDNHYPLFLSLINIGS